MFFDPRKIGMHPHSERNAMVALFVVVAAIAVGGYLYVDQTVISR